MGRILIVLLLAAVVALAGLEPAAAIELRAGPSSRVLPSETIDDDLYIASGRVAVDGRVRGDLLAAGGVVRVRGQVDGDVLAAGGTVEVSGRVGASIRAMAGTIVVEGPVGGDVVVGGGTVEIEQEARVGRDVATGGGTVTLRGSVGRNVMISGGRVEIAGTVGGNVLVRGGEVIVLPTAVVRGNLTYSSERPAQISPGARISGQVVQEPYPVRPVPSRQSLQRLRFAFGIFDFIWMLVLAVVMLALFPVGVQATAGALRSRPWASLGWGILLLIGIPIAAVVFFVILVGIPVAVLLLLLHVLALFASHVGAGLAIGQRLGARLSPYTQAIIGVGIIAVATNGPVVGVFLRFLVIAFGMGAVALAFWAGRSPGMPAGPAGGPVAPGEPAVAG